MLNSFFGKFKSKCSVIRLFYSLVEGFKDKADFRKQIAESEQQFRMNFEYARDGILWFDTQNGQVINCNRASEWFLREKAEDIKGKYFDSLYSDSPEWDEFVNGLIKGRGGTVCEISFSTGSQTRYARASGAKIRVEDEEIAQVFLHDITHLKEVEKELGAEKLKLEAVFNSAPVAMLLISEDLIIHNANREASKLAKRDLPIILSKRFGKGIGCLNCSKSIECGKSGKCKGCKMRELVQNTFTYWKAFREEDITFTFEGHKEDEQLKRLKASTEPFVVSGERFILISFDDVTEIKKLEDKAGKLLNENMSFANGI